MKFFTQGIVLSGLFLLLGLQNLAAQSCSLPAPANLWVNETTPTSIEVEWTAVAGAVNYQVTTVEVSSGSIVSVEVVPGLVHNVLSLYPDTEYEVTVKPICANDGLGGGISIQAPTGIIIVDVVVQLTCPPLINHKTTPPVNTRVPYPFNPTNIIVFDGHVTNMNNLPFKIVINDRSNFAIGKSQFYVGTTGNYSSKISFALSGNPNYVGVYYDDPSVGNFHLANIHLSSGTTGAARVVWKEEVKVETRYCDLAIFSTDDYGSDDPGDNDGGEYYGLQMAPNPATGLINISTNMDTPVQIFDLNGRMWYADEVQVGDDLQLNISNWPAGTYILRYQDEYSSQVKRLIKL